MRLPRRDLVATVLVAVALVLYVLWAAGAAPPGLDGVRATGLVVLALGFAASASAVVPHFDELMHGSRAYMAVTSLIGVVALAAGIVMLVDASGTGLGVMMGAMGLLWLIATVHHSRLAATAPASTTSRVARTTTYGPPTAGAA